MSPLSRLGLLTLVSLASLAAASPALASHSKRPSSRVSVGVEVGPFGFGFSNVHRIPAPRPYCPPPSYCPPPAHVWVPGHYETRCETVRLPGHYESVWVEPVYERRVDHCGEVTEVLVRPGYHKRVWVEGGYETREVRVWVPGCYR